MSRSFPSPTELGCSRVQLSSVPKWGTPHFGAGEGREGEKPHGATSVGTPARPLPKLLVTGFGPFPNAAENPTETLVRDIAGDLPENFGASALRALVLPTDYRRSWSALRRAQAGFPADIIVHFGLAGRAETLILERTGRKRVDPARPDAAGFAPPSGRARRSGPEALAARFPLDAVLAALTRAGFPAVLSDDAGAYVCNATLYRSLLATGADVRRLVGFVHVPPTGAGGFTRPRLIEAARVLLITASGAWGAARAMAISPGR